MKHLSHNCFILIALFCFHTNGQNSSDNNIKDGLQKINVTTIQGTISVNLPAEIHSGDRITGTVLATPTKTESNKRGQKQFEKNQKALQNYSIRFNQNTFPITDQNMEMQLSRDNPNQMQHIEVFDEKGNLVASTPVIINNTIRSKKEYTGFQIPTYLRTGNTCHIKGAFDGVSSNSSVMLNDKPLDVLAESPDRIICKIPDDISGNQQIAVSENGMTNTQSCNVVGVNLEVGKLNLLKGESTNLNIGVFGLEGINVPVKLLIENRTPQNIRLTGGDMQELIIQPNDISLQGTFNHNIPLQAKRTGSYSIDVTLVETFDDSGNDNQQLDQLPNQQLPVLTDYFNAPESMSIINPEVSMGYNNQQLLISNNMLANINFNVSVDITEEEKRDLRNKGRKLPKGTPLGPTAPDDKDKPYSRPVPPGIKSGKHERTPGWTDGDKLLKAAKKEVERAKKHTGPIGMGIPGLGHIGITSPSKTIRDNARKCTEYVYYFSQRYTYINDRTLILEEQLSPSHEFFVAEGKNEINITKNESGWSVSPSISAGIKGVSVGISGSYWEQTTHIKGKGSSSLKGRHLWLFHVGRLYLVRKAFLRIKYEYHYEVCDDGSTRNWVNTTYTDNWYYWYEWEEELFVASKDDEGNFHKVDDFPTTKHIDKMGEESLSYEADSLDPDSFESPGPDGWDFFPPMK